MPGLGDSYWFVMFFLVFGTPFGGFGQIKTSRQTKHPQLRTCRIFCDWNWVTSYCCERHEYHEWLIFLFSRKVMGSLLPGSSSGCFSSEQVSLSENSWYECISTHIKKHNSFTCITSHSYNIPAFSFRNSCILKKQPQNPRLKKIIRNCLSSWRFLGGVEEIWDSYGADVHADYEYLRSCSLGQPVKFRIRLDGGMESEGPGYLNILDGSARGFNSKWRFRLGSSSDHCYWEGHNQHIGYQGTFERWCSNKHSQGIS